MATVLFDNVFSLVKIINSKQCLNFRLYCHAVYYGGVVLFIDVGCLHFRHMQKFLRHGIEFNRLEKI